MDIYIVKIGVLKYLYIYVLNLRPETSDIDIRKLSIDYGGESPTTIWIIFQMLWVWRKLKCLLPSPFPLNF